MISKILHIYPGERRPIGLLKLKLSFTCMFGITITTERYKYIAKKYIVTLEAPVESEAL